VAERRIMAWLFPPKQCRRRKPDRVVASTRARSKAMTPHVAAGPSSTPTPDRRAGDELAHVGIIGALLEALNSPESFRLVHCDGELFIEPIYET
jgi:hypothetical protein